MSGKRNGSKAKVFHCVCVCAISRCARVCVCSLWHKAAAARIKTRAAGLLLAFFRPPDACHCFNEKQKKKRAGDEEGRRTKRREGDGGRGGGTAVQIMSRSANSSSLIRAREGTRGPLSGQGPGSNTHTHTDMHAHIVSVFLLHILTH